MLISNSSWSQVHSFCARFAPGSDRLISNLRPLIVVFKFMSELRLPLKTAASHQHSYLSTENLLRWMKLIWKIDLFKVEFGTRMIAINCKCGLFKIVFNKNIKALCHWALFGGFGETCVIVPKQLENFAPLVQLLTNKVASSSSVSGFFLHFRSFVGI